MSFKYGAQERQANGRHFTDLDEAGGRALVDDVGRICPPTPLTVHAPDAREDQPGEALAERALPKTLKPLIPAEAGTQVFCVFLEFSPLSRRQVELSYEKSLGSPLSRG